MLAISQSPLKLATQLIDIMKPQMESYRGPSFGIRVWQLSYWQPRPETPRFVIVIHTRRALNAILCNPNELGLAEAFVNGDIDIEGDLFAALDFAEHLFKSHGEAGVALGTRLMSAIAMSWERVHHLGSLVSRHSKARDRRAIAYHYDRPPEFFLPWLGKSMAYTCAYFRQSKETLDEAQSNKFEYICRKLRLRQGERMLDIGCGWGGLTLHAAKYYGVHVTGVTLSEEQARYARSRIEEEGLQGKCEIYYCDYREFKPAAGPFDKIASVGMIEHIGRRNLATYFEAIRCLLAPGGVLLNQGIVESVEENRRQGPTFIRKHVFPDSDLPTISAVIEEAEQVGFELRDVENLREHYTLTLREWVAKIEAQRDEVLQYADERSYRIWRLYMAGSGHAFRNGTIALHQVLLSLPVAGKSGLPLTRDDWSISEKYLERSA